MSRFFSLRPFEEEEEEEKKGFLSSGQTIRDSFCSET